jgi:Tfp pilus assembly ATPase PilU
MFTAKNCSHYYNIWILIQIFAIIFIHTHLRIPSLFLSLTHFTTNTSLENLLFFWPEQRQNFLLLWNVGKSIIKKYNKKGRANVIVKLLSGRCFCSYITSNVVTNFELVFKLVWNQLKGKYKISIKIAIFSNNKLFGDM